ncbi:hypothetical protein B0175_09525 [Arcobacter lacus]|uniref:histidine kinase n=1 Tax=Arcobacter lacus TaxID=1912876 RepID=A0ABX5JH89_9BACT|nr:hypothetical protein B0175_09525 [Arcobacter lacus]
MEKVKLQLQWKHQFEFAGFYAAKEKGFYKDVGLDVEFIEFDNDINIIKKVLANENMYGLTYSNLISEHLNNKSSVFIANFFKQSPLALVTQKEIFSPNDLKGKKIMGVSDQINSSMFLIIFKRFDIQSNDFISVKPTFNIEDFINKKVDAMTVFTTNETFLLDKIKYPYNLINPTVFGAEYYDLNLFTSKKELNDHPYRIERFKQASIKGWEYALSHKEEIIDLILSKYNSQHKSKESLIYESTKIEKLMMPKLYPIGSIDKNRVKLIIDDFKNLDLVDKQSNIDLDEFIYEHSKLFFSKEEFNYLNDKKYLKVCIHPKWYPFEGLDYNQEHIGVSKEYMDILSKSIRKKFIIVPTSSWQESLEFIDDKQCDILSTATPNFMEQKNLFYSNSYFSTDLVMIGRKDMEHSNLENFGNKIVGICKNLKLSNEIKAKYSNIKFVDIQNYVKGFELLEQKKIDGYINALPVMSDYLQNNYAGELKIITRLDEKLDFSFAVREDEKILVDIFNKSLSLISSEEHKRIKNKYLLPIIEKEKDLLWIKIFFAIVLIIILYLLFKQYISYKVTKMLKNEIELEIKKSKQKDNMIFHQNKLIAMGEMIENIAHQWKQPLNELNCNVFLIEEELSSLKVKNNEINTYLDNIESLTIHMARTINDFRKFYSNEKTIQEFNINLIIDEILKIIQQSLNQDNICIVKNVNNIYIENYVNEFKQVMLSILNNSKDAFRNNDTLNKNIIINVNEEKNKVIIKIEDNAGGIKEEIIGKIFNQYFSTKKNSNGTGLGLYISKMIIEDSMKGSISVESQNGRTTFVIVLQKYLDKQK